eukprot:770824-Alexandrium_andersonii.AAC.1
MGIRDRVRRARARARASPNARSGAIYSHSPSVHHDWCTRKRCMTKTCVPNKCRVHLAAATCHTDT